MSGSGCSCRRGVASPTVVSSPDGRSFRLRTSAEEGLRPGDYVTIADGAGAEHLGYVESVDEVTETTTWAAGSILPGPVTPAPFRSGSARRSDPGAGPRLLRRLRGHPAGRHVGQRSVGPGRAHPQADQPAHVLVRAERIGEDVRAWRGPGADPAAHPTADGDLRPEQRLRPPRRDPAPRPPGDGRAARRPIRPGAAPRRRSGRPARPAAVAGPGLARRPAATRSRPPPRGVQRDGASPVRSVGVRRPTAISTRAPSPDRSRPPKIRAPRRSADGWRTSGCSTGRSGHWTGRRRRTSSRSDRRRPSSISAAWSARTSSSPSP